MVTTVWAIKEKTTIKSQDGRTVVQTSKVILGDTVGVISDSPCIAENLSFMSCVRFEALSYSQDNTSWQLVTATYVCKASSCTHYILDNEIALDQMLTR